MVLEHWQLGKTALQCMGTILTDKRWTDVSFKCRDQDPDDIEACIHAHKVILAARSPVFEAMFYGPCASETYPLKMEEIDSEIFELFLMYLYTDMANLTESTAPLVLQNAHMYQVTGLVEYCFKYMIQNITVNTALDLLQMALFYKEKTYEDKTLKFIDDNADKILGCDSFLTLPQDCLFLILKGNTFDANEKKIFELAVKWAEAQCDIKSLPKDGKTVREMLKDVFYQLRVPIMSVKEFSESTFLKGYYNFEEHERILSYIAGGGDASMLPNSNQLRYPRIDEVQLVEKRLGKSEGNYQIETKLFGSVEKTLTILSFTIDTSKIEVLPGCRYCTSSCRNCCGVKPNKHVEFEGKFEVSYKELKTSEKFVKIVEFNEYNNEFSVQLRNPVKLVKQEGQFDIVLQLKVASHRIKYHEWKRHTISNNFENGCSKALNLSYGDTYGSAFNIYSIKSVIFQNDSGRNNSQETVKEDETEGTSQSTDGSAT
ncbi:BTB/POZ domain-containing protein 6-like [Mercenaria mercenaria]|uniref:BTB/POZ domain-containing protein 6-like n=1 Tax=Mercenaria mercenaria TaxID=6596 RepID=UPI00234F637C|nr:BTB/POZ domain-containing protein 6-like [Mercenaria mercenaria]